MNKIRQNRNVFFSPVMVFTIKCWDACQSCGCHDNALVGERVCVVCWATQKEREIARQWRSNVFILHCRWFVSTSANNDGRQLMRRTWVYTNVPPVHRCIWWLLKNKILAVIWEKCNRGFVLYFGPFFYAECLLDVCSLNLLYLISNLVTWSFHCML